MANPIGDMLSGMGPGLLSGIGKAINDAGGKPTHFEPKQAPSEMSGSIPKYHKGTDYVPKTGPAILKKGEAVLKPEDAEQMRRGKEMATGKHTDTVKLSHHRVVMHLNKGGLHRALGIPEGETIPEDKLKAAMNSKNEHVRRMANLAHTMAGWKH